MAVKNLPPLKTLVAFEAAARLGSFKKAAEELHLTPSAVSHQIKALESSLGFEVFTRGSRSLELNHAGREYSSVVREALSKLGNGAERIRAKGNQRRLRISAGAFIASEVIFPSLPSFHQAHPGIEVTIDTDLGMTDLVEKNVDVALRFGNGRWPGLRAHFLMEAIAVPVCSPSMAKELAKRSPGDLAGVTLIHSSYLTRGWEVWSRHCGVPLTGGGQDMWVDSYLAILRASAQGVGVGMGLLPMVSPWIKSGQLSVPWPALSYPLGDRYYLVHPESKASRPEILAFTSWVRQLIAQLDDTSANSASAA